MDPFEKAPPSVGYQQLPVEHPVQQPIHYEKPPVEYMIQAPQQYLGSFQQVHAPPHVVVPSAPIAVASIPMEGAFQAHLVSNRHHKFVIMSDMELGFHRCEHPTVWLFSPSPLPGAYLVSTVWAPAATRVPLVLQRPVSPAFLRADQASNWRLCTGLDPVTDEYLFRVEQHGGGLFSLRCVASSLLVSAESRCLRANRNVFHHWEEFQLVMPNAHLQQHMPVAVVDPLLTQAVQARVRFRSLRYNSHLGVRSGRLCFTDRDSEFVLEPAVPGAVRIVCAGHPNRCWRVIDGRGALAIDERHHHHEVDRAELFALERSDDGKSYSIRSVRTGRICVALCSGLVANREHRQLWEQFALELL